MGEKFRVANLIGSKTGDFSTIAHNEININILVIGIAGAVSRFLEVHGQPFVGCTIDIINDIGINISESDSSNDNKSVDDSDGSAGDEDSNSEDNDRDNDNDNDGTDAVVGGSSRAASASNVSGGSVEDVDDDMSDGISWY
ncbi:hypothetical protein KQX54_020406 [Cotesia glomerata]|uniref:Uncharacterized protein n=1 Tax=Cotesia glomerata TaxID=32391 RepID=A0AAV7IHG5_COTGL|nr:hypothetical protein KQX54_020406 [Cotesia glomerata]